MGCARARRFRRKTGLYMFVRMYREFLAPAELRSTIECYWQIEGDYAAPRRNRIVPDGCADIILDLCVSGTCAGGPAQLVVGTMTRHRAADVIGAVSLLGVRFRAGGLTPLLGVTASELTDAVLPLGDLWTDAASIHDEVATAAPAERIPRLTAILRRRVEQRRARDATVSAADALLRQSHGAISVTALLQHLGIGARRLQRLYATHVGASPQFAARVYRLRHALRLLRESDTPAAQVAVLAGFFDQPHMIRDLRELAGTTPDAYRREQRVASIQAPAALPR